MLTIFGVHLRYPIKRHGNREALGLRSQRDEGREGGGGGGGGSSNYTESGKVDRRELKYPSERMDWRKRFAC